MKRIKDILNIPSEYLDVEKKEHQREIQKKVDHLLEAMAMRLVLHSYSLPESVYFVACKLKEVYKIIKDLESSYEEAIKKMEYTDWILQNRLSLDEQREEFLELARELYDETAKLKEAPICIRENFFILKSEITKFGYLKEECTRLHDIQ